MPQIEVAGVPVVKGGNRPLGLARKDGLKIG
jgi:hypothetical protein